MLKIANMLVIKQQQKALVISENKQVTKKGEERSETEEMETDNKKGDEKEDWERSLVTPPKYLKKALHWGTTFEGHGDVD